jgi:hypothetical protein
VVRPHVEHVLAMPWPVSGEGSIDEPAAKSV